MIIEKIVVENFMSFYGTSCLSLERGLNFVVGVNGSGKTNLVRAFCFAVAGHTFLPYKVPLNRLINDRHRAEVSNPSCRVQVEIEDARRKLHAQSSLSLVGERVTQSSAVDLGLDEIALSGKLKQIIINSENVQEQLSLTCSTGARWDCMMQKSLELNMKAGIKMAIIDGAWGYLDPYRRKKMLDLLAQLPMEQVIIMVNLLGDEIENYPCTIHRIEYDPDNDSSRIEKQK